MFALQIIMQARHVMVFIGNRGVGSFFFLYNSDFYKRPFMFEAYFNFKNLNISLS